MSVTASIHQNGDTLAIEGPLIVETVNTLMQAAPEFSGESTKIDMAGATELDSAGLSLLVFWEMQAKQKGGAVVFQGVSAQAASLMEVSGLGHMVSAG